MKRPLFSSQAFWALVAVVALMLVLSVGTDVFATQQNLFNIARNASFIAIMALGVTPVLIAGEMDLSVGSIMGLSAIVTGMVLQDGASLYVGVLAGLASGLV
ncbi:MAG: ABC transporter permease, partial [Alphaproteobacteria bacterium]|nr:ABC transporter permease [Alphaproteobacteria bacterium]